MIKILHNELILKKKILQKKGDLKYIRVYGYNGYADIKMERNILVLKNDSATTFYSHLNNLNYTLKLIKTLSKGLFHGYKKFLEIRGIGYKASIKDKNLCLDLGYSSPAMYKITNNIDLKIKKSRIIKIFSYDYNTATQTAARLRLFKKPDPYKGKGIRYTNEIIILKEGKKKKK